MQEQNNTLTDFSEALNIVLSTTKELKTKESVPLFAALKRTLAEDIVCRKALPAFTNSAMDGYGVKTCDAGKKVVISGAVMAGDAINSISIKMGECVKIMTGAPVPISVEAVVPFENAVSVEENSVTLPEFIKKNANIRAKGEESNVGDTLLRAGDTLTPAAIGSLASQGVFVVKVAAKPKVAVISSGNEIAEPWEAASENQIYNSNAAMLMALCIEKGCEPHYVKLLDDSYEATLQTIRSLFGYDLILTTGGISMGEADFIGRAFLECGLKALFKKVALKPGKPTMFGYLGESAVLALPGNPISAVANFHLFGSAIIARLTGAKAAYIGYVEAKNKSYFDIKDSRANLILGSYKNGFFEVYEGARYGSGMVRPITQSNSFIMTGKGVTCVEEGRMVKVILIDSPLFNEPCDFMSAE